MYAFAQFGNKLLNLTVDVWDYTRKTNSGKEALLFSFFLLTSIGTQLCRIREADPLDKIFNRLWGGCKIS